MYCCRYCGKEFTRHQSKYRHEKTSCKKRLTKDDGDENMINRIEELKQFISRTTNSSDNQLMAVDPQPSDNIDQPDNLNNQVNHVKINYVLPKQNYWEILTDKMGTPGALEFLHRCADLKLGGDILLFEELFLPPDNKDSWPVARKKGSSKELILKEPDGTIVEDCASKVIYERFVSNYKDALLEGSNKILSILVEPEKIELELQKEKDSKKIYIRGVSKNISQDELEKAYTSIFTDYDFGKFQHRAYEILHEHPKPHGRFSAGMIQSNF